MAQDIASGGAGDMSNVLTDFSVNSSKTDDDELWANRKWEQYKGYFDEVAEFNAIVTALAKWTVGKGFTGEEEITNKWRGNGTDTANSIFKNGVMTSEVGGDFFAEIIRDDGIFKKLFVWFGVINPGKPVNLKPLDPGKIAIISTQAGFIKHYEQISNKTGEPNKVIKPENMFHVPRNRFADNVHGTALTTQIEKIILAYNESISDYKQVQHRFVKPRWIIKLNTDKTTKINAEKVKWDTANENGENMYIPMGSVEAEQMSIAEGSTLDPVKWQESLSDKFYEGTVPRVIIGNSKGSTEAGTKVVYLGFEQTVAEKQLFWEEQIEAQLGLKIKFKSPPKLEQDMKRDQAKDNSGASKPSDTTATMDGNK